LAELVLSTGGPCQISQDVADCCRGWGRYCFGNARPNQLCLHTYDTISLTIFRVLFLDPDSLVTTVSVKRLRQQQHRVLYELTISTKCNWHCVQDEEHVLLDCLNADLANLRVKHR